MEINIKGHDLTVTQSIEKYIKDKFSNIIIPEKMNVANFTIGKHKTSKFIRFDTHVLNKDLHLEEGDDDLYAAIDKIMNKIKISFVKMKGKRNVPMHVSKKF